MKKKKSGKKKVVRGIKMTKRQKRKVVCEKYNEEAMCYRCLNLARSLLLCGELEDNELARIRKTMEKIITKRGVLKEEVAFLSRLSDEYLS